MQQLASWLAAEAGRCCNRVIRVSLERHLPAVEGGGQMSAIPAPGERAGGYPRALSRTGESGRLGLALVVIASAQLMVVLDATIVNVALPHVQRALGFSGSGLEWVVNAYAVTFGGLLLLGGRAGDRLGRRRVFVAGLVLFSAASLLGGFATSQWWLLAARAVQGAGGAVIAPNALALITTNFPEGEPRNRAMGVYSAMAGGGGAVGLLLGGVLTSYVSWRWVLFVNVPIGIIVAAAARRVLAESPRRPGPVDVAGAVTATTGVALLVYGLSKAGTGPDGVSHWGDALVLASLAAAAVLIAAFVLIELRSSHPLLPMRVLADRNRSGAYLIMLCIGTAMFGMFFFLTLFAQTVLGYSAVRSGISYLPFTIGIVTAATLASRLVARVGPRPLILAGTAAAAGGMFWFSRLTEHAGYPGQLLGPMLVTSCGLGLLFVPLALVALHNVADQHAGVAASLLNTGQQVGGAIGLAALGTIAWTTVAGNLNNARAAAAAGRQPPASPAQLVTHALATGFSRGFLAAAGIALLGLLVALATIRVRRQELTGAGPAPHEDTTREPATVREPVAVRQHENRAALAAAARPCRPC
jgi:EmrB/QacA subfamily drug resistance transporter